MGAREDADFGAERAELVQSTAVAADLLVAQGLDRAFQRAGLDVGQHDVHALAAEGLGHGQAHAAGAAGDEGGLAVQVFHDRCLPSMTSHVARSSHLRRPNTAPAAR